MNRATIRLLALPSLLIVGAAYLTVAVALPARRGLHELRGAIAHERGKLELTQQTSEVQRRLSEAEQLRRDAEAALASSTLPSGQELGLITSLERLAGRHSVVQKNVQLADHEATGAPGWTVTDLSLDLSGTYPRLVAYLRDLERSPYLVTIEHVRLSGTGEVQASLRGRVLWRPSS